MSSRPKRSAVIRSLGIWMILGIAIGVAFGASVENIPVGIVIGIGTGLFIGFLKYRYQD